jgi:N-acetyl-gamma-glutamyl-phosphate reductase
MIQVHVAGAAGYAGSEFVRLALRHPDIELGVLSSPSLQGDPIGAHVPGLRTFERLFDPPETLFERARAGDAAVLAFDAATARTAAPRLLEAGVRVIDLSDAFRLQQHAGEAVYGLSERYRDALRDARLVANPGCYPTAALLGLLPLAPFANDLRQLVVDAKSGVTGSGRTPALGSLFAEVEGNVRAYGLGTHRHQSEIEQELQAAGIDAPLVFTPHVVPLRRGLLADCYACFQRPPDEDALRAAYLRAYAGSPFVRLLAPEHTPNLPGLAGGNGVELHVSLLGNVVRTIVALDNLGKGAAGQALQNFNLMFGLPEERALDDRALVV